LALAILVGVGVLEKDDAAELEQIPAFEALVHIAIHASSGRSDEIDIGVLMLPASEQVHRCGVDFLHDTLTPALHFGAADKHVVARCGAAEPTDIGAGAEQAGHAHIGVYDGGVLVVVLGPLTVQHR